MKNKTATNQSQSRDKQATARVSGHHAPIANSAHKEEQLDEALKETFPASDPISVGKARGSR